jgi:hypothetical protein
LNLNKNQRKALLIWLGNIGIIPDSSIISFFDEFADGKFAEWRIIYHFGSAGKLWNHNGRIYVSGHHSRIECGGDSKVFQEEMEQIDAWNTELQKLMNYWADRS